MKKEFFKSLYLVGGLAFTLLVLGCSNKVSYSHENLSSNDNTKNHELFDATKEEDLKKVKALLETGVDVNAKNELEETLLHHVKNVETAKLLIEKGADGSG